MKPGRSRRGTRLALGCALALCGAAGAVDVDFERETYTVAPGQPLELQVLIDFEDHVPQSLFSYGMRMTSAPDSGVTVTNIEVPPELDHVLSGPASMDLSPGIWSVKGHVDWFSSYYTGALLATYTVQFTQPGTYTLGLVLDKTQASAESVFVDGDGISFDSELTLMGTTQVVVGHFESWAEARGLTPGVNAGYLDDPNRDGCANIQHFAFDSDPLGGGCQGGKWRAAFTNIGGADYLTLTIPVRSGAVFSGNPLTSNVVDGISYVILGDADLVDPWDLTVVELIPVLADGLPSLGDYDALSGPDWQYRTFRLTNPVSTSSHAFLRAGVTPGHATP